MDATEASREPRWASTRDVWRRHIGYVGAFLVNVSLACYFGITMILAPERFGARTYDALRYSLGLTTWGSVLLVYGLLLASCAWQPAKVTMFVFWVGSFAYTLLAGWFAVGLGDPQSSPWGPGVFIALAVWQLTQRNAYGESLRSTP